jgi:hypothetical protein
MRRIGIEYALNVSVQRSHDADAREHRRPAQRCDQYQGFHGSLPLRGRVFDLRQAGSSRIGQLGGLVHGLDLSELARDLQAGSLHVEAVLQIQPQFRRRSERLG